MQHGPRPLQEKMTLFWHNHFATSIEKVSIRSMMYAQNQIFRNLAHGAASATSCSRCRATRRC